MSSKKMPNKLLSKTLPKFLQILVCTISFNIFEQIIRTNSKVKENALQTTILIKDAIS